MRSTFRLTALIAAVVAVLAFSSTAMAKGGGGGGAGGGGGGGGGGACATIDSLTVNTTATGRSLDAVVTMNCLDEFSGTVAFDFINPATGVRFGRSVIMSNLGTRTYSISASTATPTLITVTVAAPNGKVQDTQSITIG